MNNNLGNKEIMAKNILRYMKLYNKERKDVCRDLHIRYTTFTDWVNGKTYPRIDKIEMLANYFHVSKADLVEESEEIETSQMILSSDESGLLATYRLLNNAGQQKVRDYAEDLADNDRYTLEDKPHLIPIAAHDDGATPEQINEDKELLQ